MNRRQFLAVIAGLPWVYGHADTCGKPADGCATWTKTLRASGSVDPDTNPPYTGIPALAANFLRFTPAAECFPRRAWSTIRPDRDSQLLHDLTDAYCRMNSLPQSDPRSLIQQSWLHRYYFQAPNDVHSTWWFLPWHRAFLHYHEQILGHLIQKPSFRLPYWDWDRPDRGGIPQFFQDLGLPNFLIGSSGRTPTPNNWTDPCTLQAWLVSSTFESFLGRVSQEGLAMQGPHALGHYLAQGAMRRLETAAADPLFYGHHGNVDRYWVYWQQQYGFTPPDEWLRKTFIFHDAQCRQVKVTVPDVLDTKRLGYFYEDMPSVPLSSFQSLYLAAIPHDLSDQLKQLGMGILASHGGSPIQQYRDLLSGGTSYDTVLRGVGVSALPLRTELSLSAVDLKPGYYLVQAVRDGEGPYKIGGFGVLHSMHTGMLHPYRVVAVGCLDPKLTDSYMRDPKGFKLQYGRSTDGSAIDLGSPIDLEPGEWAIELLHPKVDMDRAKELLKVLPPL